MNTRRHLSRLWPLCRAAGVVWGAFVCALSPAQARAELPGAGLSTFGLPGLIEMPGAAMPADATLTFGLSADPALRGTLGFQALPGLAASVRVETEDGAVGQSLSLVWRLQTETDRRPAVVIGLTDVVGSDLYRSEFVAASKSVSRTVRVTAGLGWGRLAGSGGFGNPMAVFSGGLADRAPGSGDTVDVGEAFRGDAALFGGVAWQASDRLRLLAEVSSLAPGDRTTPVNLGLTYALTDALTVGAHVLGGDAVGLRLTHAIDPRVPPFGAGVGSAPLPVLPRTDAGPGDVAGLAPALRAQGLALHALSLSGQTARIEVENNDHAVAARAVGRAMRALSRTMPDSITTFEVVLIEQGLAVSSVRLARADVEALEHDLDGAWTSYVRAGIDAAPVALTPDADAYPRVSYGIAPYVAASIAGGDAGLLADVGIDLTARYAPAPGLVFAGTVRQKLGGTLEQLERAGSDLPPILPPVRSDLAAYAGADVTVPLLTGAFAFRLQPEVYGRVTAGLIEPMFGGIAGEVLWLPQGSAFAVGAEVAFAMQRDPGQVFGFADYDTVTGHLSGYWDMGGGYAAQLDLGRYLAGDWGGTLTLARDFDNGWRVGAFATLTDAGFDDSGSGDFDRGLLLSMPVGWASGGPRRETADLTLRPVLGDGGARLAVDGLYDALSPASAGQLASGWAEVWR